ncbi:MAG: efflux RND transporter periplasmic adaptor subunit [Cytophagaceae bacterium]|nr:efflux RND transporter periplasmic adaptor subunit [Cytophagaceae bacterium]MDW8455481.1 efflux RND transporter periplasmic adaptor subunit [Cytophagaceae bacterium]
MLKKIIPITIAALAGATFIYTLYFLYLKSTDKKETYATEQPAYMNIVQKTVASGSVNPRKEVEIKSQVSGVVDKIYVTEGEYIKTGQLLARIKIVPNVINLHNAESNLNKARIAYEDAQREYERYKKLFEEKLISEVEYNKYLLAFQNSKENLIAAENNLQLIREGSAKNFSATSTLVRSTVEGTLLSLPVKEGSFVIESNTFNAGTTIATVADMNDMIFTGKVDESEVGKIKTGMKLELNVGAIENKKYEAILEFISPKGVIEDGAVKFEIKAAVKIPPQDFIRAGYSANADIIFARRDSVLSIKEALLKFGKNDSVYVEVEKEPNVFEKRLVKTGISDGINIEILSGLSPKDKIKVQYKTDYSSSVTSSSPMSTTPRTGRGRY